MHKMYKLTPNEDEKFYDITDMVQICSIYPNFSDNMDSQGTQDNFDNKYHKKFQGFLKETSVQLSVVHFIK